MNEYMARLLTTAILVATPLIIKKVFGFEVAVLVTLACIWNVTTTPRDIREILNGRKR